jgi:hypothetical protein
MQKEIRDRGRYGTGMTKEMKKSRYNCKDGQKLSVL